MRTTDQLRTQSHGQRQESRVRRDQSEIVRRGAWDLTSAAGGTLGDGVTLHQQTEFNISNLYTG